MVVDINDSFKRLFDQAATEIFITDAETLKFVYANEAAIKNLGYPKPVVRRQAVS